MKKTRNIRRGCLCGTFLLLLAASCSTPRDIAYFQDVASGTAVSPSHPLEIRVRPEDKLSIVVSTQDPALSGLFNLVVAQNRIASAGANSSSSGSGDGRTALYVVNKSGDINFPVLGRFHVGGMTRQEVADYIEGRLKDGSLVKDPIVTVDFANTGLSIIGEVSSPGRYEFNRDRLNIIDALAMAGDLTPNGQRRNVTVLREDADGKTGAYRIDLTDMGSLAESPVYYLQQNDIIYVEPNDKKKRDTTANGNTPFTPAFWMSVGSFGITIATLIITLTK